MHLWRKMPNCKAYKHHLDICNFSSPLVLTSGFSLDISSFFHFLLAAFDWLNSSGFSMSFSMVMHLGSSLSYTTGASVLVIPSSLVIPGTETIAPTSTILPPLSGGNNSTMAPSLNGHMTTIMHNLPISEKASHLHSTIIGTSSPLAMLAANSTSLAMDNHSDNQLAVTVHVLVCQAGFVVGILLVAEIVAGVIWPWWLDATAMSTYINAENPSFIIINDGIFCIVELFVLVYIHIE